MMDLPDLRYVDVSAHMELMQSLERWPLLAHLETQRKAQPGVAPLDLHKRVEQTP